MSSSTYDPMVGAVLDDRYEILAKLARGGMATVYRARDLRLERIVAVKIMRSDLGDDDELTAKFDREARAAATIMHPAVVGIFDQGTAHGRPYIVMEFIDGETLRRRIGREGAMPPERVFELLDPIVAALAAAHEIGLVHRDIKPENVLISSTDKVKVADFGLARLTEAPQMTATGVLVGTASYLPPELVTHSRPDSRSDVYSTGIVVFEMLTGSKPHTGENNYQIAYRHVNVDVEPPSKRLAERGKTSWVIPDYVDAFVAACTARNPERRIADGTAMLKLVREIRRRLSKDPAANAPGFAATIRPVPDADDALTQPISQLPPARPRPGTGSARSAASPSENSNSAADSLQSVAATASEPMRPTTQADQTWQPRSSRPTRPTASAARPIAPSAAEPTPRSPSTPPLAGFKLSSDPVHRRRRRIAALAVLLLAVLAAAGAIGWWWTEGRYTTVPSLTQLSEEEATEAAAANDLQLTTTTAYSEEVAKGLVISSDPKAGTRLLRDETVSVTLSLGPERFAMPEVVGLTLDQAKAELAARNLKLGATKEAWDEKVPTGVIVSASEEVDAPLPRDTKVDVVVSKGPEPIKVTDYTGKPAAEAKTALEKLGFVVKLSQEHSRTVAKDAIISQKPNTGTLHRGDTVALVSSLGPVMVEIPDVQYDRLEVATNKLKSLGLEVEIEYETPFPQPLNIAIRTDPKAGTSVAEGTSVKLFVS